MRLPGQQSNILLVSGEASTPPREELISPYARPRAMIEPCPAMGTSKSGERMRHVPAKGPLACATMRRNARCLPSLLHTASWRSERKCLPSHLGSDDKKPVHGSHKGSAGAVYPPPAPTAERPLGSGSGSQRT